ncbi:unnamed protein product [Paramecium primaurelia]|uniref:Uncharacterized protein n=1 Tax=Paramecium primaurelia TaxID=5886 RepID=A0A8S1NHR1_PARPR|nr:unnamed protein product [Paramecium primaurelia]
MLQEKIKNYIKSRECATNRVKTLLRQPCPIQFQVRSEFSPQKTIHQFQSQNGRVRSVLKLSRKLTRQCSPPLKFDEIITNAKSNIARRTSQKQQSAPLLKQRVKDVNLQTQFPQVPTFRMSSQWFGKQNRSQSNQFAFVTLSTLIDDEFNYNKERVSKFNNMENRLVEHQFIINDFDPILNVN